VRRQSGRAKARAKSGRARARAKSERAKWEGKQKPKVKRQSGMAKW